NPAVLVSSPGASTRSLSPILLLPRRHSAALVRCFLSCRGVSLIRTTRERPWRTDLVFYVLLRVTRGASRWQWLTAAYSLISHPNAGLYTAPRFGSVSS